MYRLGDSVNADGWPFLYKGHAFLADGTPLTECNENGQIVPAAVALNRIEKDCSSGNLCFRGPQVHAWQRLDAGPEAIAAAVQTGLAKFDLAAAIGGGTIERMWATQPESYNLTQRLDHSLCGIYLGKYAEAQSLLKNCQEEAAKGDDDSRYASFAARCKTYLAKLIDDPAALRLELIATMNKNWSHFKIVDV
jgi:hypothetical protein